MASYRLTGPLSDSDFLFYYQRIKSNPDFYAEKFGEQLFNDSAYIQLAKFLVDAFKPVSAYDIGCGKGRMVESLRLLGVNARGLDWSHYLLQSAPENLQEYLDCADLLDSVPDNKMDLVTCMETLEHFPPGLVPQAISQLKQCCGDYIFATIPSFGPNSFGPAGLQVINKEWLNDAKNDRYFRYIVVDNEDNPHHGHLTLATYRWWTNQFLRAGLLRNFYKETVFHKLVGDFLKHHLWNIYILQEIREHSINFDSGSDHQLGPGWYDREFFDRAGKPAGVRWTERKAICYLKAERQFRILEIDFFSGPIQLLYDIELYITVFHCTMDKILRKRETLVVNPEKWFTGTIDLGDTPPGILEVTLELENAWVSKHYTEYNDPRELGVAVHSITIR